MCTPKVRRTNSDFLGCSTSGVSFYLFISLSNLPDASYSSCVLIALVLNSLSNNSIGICLGITSAGTSPFISK